MAPREGLELELMKLGCTGPPLEPRRRPQAGKSGDPCSQNANRAELHRLSELALRSVVDHLWPEGPRSNSYFGLVQRFLGDVPHIDTAKRSACIEGARMALARVKTYWAEMDATTVASRGLDKSRFPTEHYFEEVLQGARLIESQCSKDVMFK